MKYFSPFDKPINDIKPADLAILRNVSEGWYVEYKQEEPKASTLAKSIAAFANTYGGWFFLGVQEESKENAVAGAFLGIERVAVDACLQRLRQSAADQLNPTPHFETKVLWGPIPELGLAEDRAVICTWVSQSAAAPHVHKNGHIYRRVADSSEPRPENDRFVLDQLWRRGDELKRFHTDWAGRDPEFSKGENESPYVRLMLTPDPWRQRDLWVDDEDQVRAALQKTPGVVAATPFDTVYTSAEGFVGRQLKGNAIGNMGVTWRLRRDLTSDVIIPLQMFESDGRKLREWLEGYEFAAPYISVLDRHRGHAGSVRIVDLNFLFALLIGVVEIQERLLKLANWSEPYHLKVKLLGAWRTVPFLDVPAVIERFDHHGLPMCLDRQISFPLISGPKNYVAISRHLEIQDNPAARILVQALDMFTPLALSYGIPSWMEVKTGTDAKPYYQELMEVGNRARIAQGFRNSSVNEF